MSAAFFWISPVRFLPNKKLRVFPGVRFPSMFRGFISYSAVGLQLVYFAVKRGITPCQTRIRFDWLRLLRGNLYKRCFHLNYILLRSSEKPSKKCKKLYDTRLKSQYLWMKSSMNALDSKYAAGLFDINGKACSSLCVRIRPRTGFAWRMNIQLTFHMLGNLANICARTQ